MTLIVAAALLFCAGVLTIHAATIATESLERPRKDAPAPFPFEPTEQLIYEAEFSKLLLRGIKIAEFKFTAGRAPAVADAQTQTSASASKVASVPLLFVGDIESKGWFRKLFGINFHYRVESTVESDSFAVLRTTKLDEQGKRVRTSEAIFDRAENKVAWTERDPNNSQRPPRIVTNPLGGAMHDIISAIYFLRTQPLAPGKTFDLVLSDSGQIYHVPATVSAEKKKMKSLLGKVPVVRVDVALFGDNRPVEGKGQMSMWVTDDTRRLPVRAKISSDLGTLDITLKNIKTK